MCVCVYLFFFEWEGGESGGFGLVALVFFGGIRIEVEESKKKMRLVPS